MIPKTYKRNLTSDIHKLKNVISSEIRIFENFEQFSTGNAMGTKT